MLGIGLGLNKYRKVGGESSLDLGTLGTVAAWFTFEQANVLNDSMAAVSTGNTIGQVLDKSGNDLHLIKHPSATSAPIWTESGINGIPVATFDGTSKILWNEDISLSQTFTIGIVFKYSNAFGGTNEFIYDSVGTGRSGLYRGSGNDIIYSGSSLVYGS